MTLPPSTVPGSFGARPQPEPGTALPPPQAVELWFALARQPFASLAIVQASPGEAAATVAKHLAAVAALVGGGAAQVLDTRAMQIGTMATTLRQMRGASQRDEGADVTRFGAAPRIFVAVDSLENAAAMPLLLGADAVLLAVTLGESDLQTARAIVEKVGAERFRGCVTFPSTRR